jgi:hypothetical protein
VVTSPVTKDTALLPLNVDNSKSVTGNDTAFYNLVTSQKQYRKGF